MLVRIERSGISKNLNFLAVPQGHQPNLDPPKATEAGKNALLMAFAYHCFYAKPCNHFPFWVSLLVDGIGRLDESNTGSHVLGHLG